MRVHVHGCLVEESQKGRGVSLFVSHSHWRNLTMAGLRFGQSAQTFASLITSHITFSTRPSMDFHTLEEFVDLWQFPNIRQNLNGPLQPKVVGLDVHLRCILVEPGSKEGPSCGHEVLHWWEPGYQLESLIQNKKHHSAYLIGCWTADGICFRDIWESDAYDPCWPFPGVCHCTREVMLVSKWLRLFNVDNETSARRVTPPAWKRDALAAET